MKKAIAILILGFSAGTVFAADLFQNNNPFPQTQPQSMNNLYEAADSTLQHEIKQKNKAKIKKGKNIQEQEIQDIENRLYKAPPYEYKNEGVQDGSFYMFK